MAVKVQRPGIGESIATDMLLLRRLMAAVDDNLPQVGGWGGLGGGAVKGGVKASPGELG